MKTNQRNLKKIGALTLTSAILLGGILPSSSYAAENDITNIESFSLSNMPEEAKKLDIIDTKKNSKEYLSEAEVKIANPYTMTLIYEELNTVIQSGKYTEEEINKIAAEKIKSSLKRSAVLRGYSIPGLPNLTDAEVQLAKSHPFEFITYGTCSVEAITASKSYYGETQLWKGNGDAYRHAYWNAILVKRLGGTKGRDHGDARAKIWTDAHEQNSLGVDKEMDLQNNRFGRATAYDNYSWSNDQYSIYLRESVSKGALVRIVNEQLVATNDVTGK